MTSAPTDPMLDRLVDGRYRVARRIARGGMATVYVADDLRLDRQVAIKIMHGHLADDEAFRERFVQEARSAARLAHPNVVSVFDQGQDDEMAFMVMEYLPGMTLRDLLKDYGRLTTEQTLDIMEAVLGGLAAAHKAGIVHRDVKPENVLLADDGRIKIGDFGLARAASANTATGQALLGTIAYLSPELLTRGVADARSDLYASGIMMYEMLVGEQPYLGEQPMQIAFQHANETVPAPSVRVAGIPHEVDELVRWATAKSPDDRPHDARDLLEALLEAEASVAAAARRAAAMGAGASASTAAWAGAGVDETTVMPTSVVRGLDGRAGGAAIAAGAAGAGAAGAGGAAAAAGAAGAAGAGGAAAAAGAAGAAGADRYADETGRYDSAAFADDDGGDGFDDEITGETQILRPQRPKGGRRATARAEKARARAAAAAAGAGGSTDATGFGAAAPGGGVGVAAGHSTSAAPAASTLTAGASLGAALGATGASGVRGGSAGFAAGFGAPGTHGGGGTAAAYAPAGAAASTRPDRPAAPSSSGNAVAEQGHRPGGAVEKLQAKGRRRKKRGWIILALIVILVTAGGTTGWYFSSGPGGHVTIPAVADQTPADATAMLQGLGLQVGEQESATSPTVPVGGIIGTDPGTDASVSNGSPVSLIISAGPAQLPVPSLVGSMEDAARAAVAGLFTVTDSQGQFAGDVAAGTVMQALGADGQPLGATYGEQQPVTFVVSLGGVPDVVGKAPDDATAALGAVNLQATIGSSDYDETIPEGDVISIGLPPAPVVPGNTVTLNTSKGPAPVPVPDVAGKNWADAKAALQAAGFTLKYRDVADIAPAVFVVSATDPAPGTTLPRGSAVTVSFAGF